MSNTSPAVSDYYQSPRMEVVELLPVRGARVLDVGCAAGAMGEELKRRGALEVVGLEVVSAAAEVARSRLDAVHEVNLNDCPTLPYGDGHFDFIVCADVLEHLVDPLTSFRHLLRYLKPEGQVLLSLPNVRHESVVLPLLVDGRWQYQDMGIMDKTHLRFFTLREILGFVKDAGLSPMAQVHTVRSEPSAYLEKACSLVQALNGDVARFRDEATVIQYLVAAERPSANAWEGANTVKVLLCPDWSDPSEHWATAASAFCASVGPDAPITLGVTVNSQDAFERFKRVRPSISADVMALSAPSLEYEWLRLFRDCSAFIITAEQDALANLAVSLNKNVFDGRDIPPNRA